MRTSATRVPRFYDGDGDMVRYEDMLDRCGRSDVVLFGEIHDSQIVHRLQRELAADLFAARKRGLVLGAEMFETDVQPVVDEYLAGRIDVEHFIKDARVWENYDTGYRPLVDAARESGLRFIATNIPRRYARLVAREGMQALDGLAAEEKQWIAPLPITLDLSAPGYQEVMHIGRAHGAHRDVQNFVAAQAVKDATMAYFILRNRAPGELFLHINGDFHSKDRGGICWYLKRYDPDVSVLSLSSVVSDAPGGEQGWKGRADVVIVVPAGTDGVSS